MTDFRGRNGSIPLSPSRLGYCSRNPQTETYTSRSEARVFGLYSRGSFPPYFSSAGQSLQTGVGAIGIGDRRGFGLTTLRAAKLYGNFRSTT